MYMYMCVCPFLTFTELLSVAGPTSFAPVIEMAIDIVIQSGCQYHVLLIIADGQACFGVSMIMLGGTTYALSYILVNLYIFPFS